jgi:hypothetical protein
VPWVDWAFAAIAAPVWALGIPIGAGVRSAVTVRALSPRPSPSRPGPDRDTKQVGGGWVREGGGIRWVDWVLRLSWRGEEHGNHQGNGVHTTHCDCDWVPQ